jgi:hypothetical protein
MASAHTLSSWEHLVRALHASMHYRQPKPSPAPPGPSEQSGPRAPKPAEQ